MNYAAWFDALIVIAALGFVTWIYSVYKKDVSMVDSLWSLMFLAAAGVYFITADAVNDRSMFILALVALWALRLSIFLTVRNWNEPEDRRYVAIRANNEPFWIKSLYIVFGLQGILAWFISVPLLAAINIPSEFGLLDMLAAALWLTGFIFEAAGDQQLYKFKANSDNAGKVLDTGLWRYTRHPNYFGETLIWWGYYLFAIQAGAWWIIAAPILMTVLLLKVSGVAMMESTIVQRRGAYAEYIARTNAFIPGPRRAASAASNDITDAAESDAKA